MASELVYCEVCGDIIKDESTGTATSPHRFVCPSCVVSGHGTSPSREPEKRRGEPVALEKLLDSEGMDLFSQGTIALRRKLHEDRATAGGTREAPLQLRGEVDPARSEAGTESAGPASGPASSEIELRRELPPATGGLAEPGAPAPAEDPGPLRIVSNGSPPTLQSQGSEAPASRAQKIVFRCLHCKAMLSIRPVGTTSRLTCPYCSNQIYVTMSGKLLTKPPSFAERQGSAKLGKLGPDDVTLDSAPKEAAPAAASARAPEATPAPGPPVAVEIPPVRESATPAIRESVPPRGSSGNPGSSRGSTRRRVSSSAISVKGSSRGSGSARAPASGARLVLDAGLSRPGSSRGLAARGRGGTGPSVATADPDPTTASAGGLPAPTATGSGAVSASAGVRVGGSEVAGLVRGNDPDHPLLRQTGSRAVLVKIVWGLFLTATLTVPPLSVAGLRHLALDRPEPTGAATDPSRVGPPRDIPPLFETFGHIASSGFEKLQGWVPSQ